MKENATNAAQPTIYTSTIFSEAADENKARNTVVGAIYAGNIIIYLMPGYTLTKNLI